MQMESAIIPVVLFNAWTLFPHSAIIYRTLYVAGYLKDPFIFTLQEQMVSYFTVQLFCWMNFNQEAVLKLFTYNFFSKDHIQNMLIDVASNFLCDL